MYIVGVSLRESENGIERDLSWVRRGGNGGGREEMSGLIEASGGNGRKKNEMDDLHSNSQSVRSDQGEGKGRDERNTSRLTSSRIKPHPTSPFFVLLPNSPLPSFFQSKRFSNVL